MSHFLEVCLPRQIANGAITQYQVKWVDWDSKHNTWEPLEHLAGCESMIADMHIQGQGHLVNRLLDLVTKKTSNYLYVVTKKICLLTGC